MKEKIKFFFILFVIYFTLTLKINSIEIRQLASVDNNLINNHDLMIEVKLNETLRGGKILKNQYNLILDKLIEYKIKELEIKKNKIQIPESVITENLMKIIDISRVEKNILDKLMKNIEIEIGWKKLIYIEYRNKLEINLNEIEEIKNKSKANESGENLILMEKNKKINIIEVTHFNKVKNQYLIKKY